MGDLGLVLVGAPHDDYLELARTTKGRLFRKQILSYGSMAHPNIAGAKLTVDEGVADSLIKNFEAKVCPIVQVPVVDDANKHVEDPFRNIGEIVGLEKGDDGVYAFVDARKKEAADELGNTLIGASAFMHMDYTDTKTGKKVGPTLLHVAVTNRPYVTDLKDYEEVIAASAADTSSDEDLVLFTPDATSEDTDMPEQKPEDKLESLLATLKNTHNIDVAALQAQAAKAEETKPEDEKEEEADDNSAKELVEALSNVLKGAGVAQLSGKSDEEVTVNDVAQAVVELSQTNLGLQGKVEALELSQKEAAEKATTIEVEGLVKAGKVLPAQKDAMLELALSNREMFERLVPDTALVSLSEDGVTTHDQPQSEQMSKDIERLVALAHAQTTGKKA